MMSMLYLQYLLHTIKVKYYEKKIYEIQLNYLKRE